MIYTFGVLWSSYTPAVEGQLIRDVMALQSTYKCDIGVIVPDQTPIALLKGLGVTPILGPQSLASLWVIYQTTATKLEAPEHATNVIDRNLYQAPAEGTLDTGTHTGYYLAPQGRAGNTSTIMNKPAPTSVGLPDPYIMQRWG